MPRDSSRSRAAAAARPSRRHEAARRNEERRGQIVRAAVRLFSEKGYYPTTMEDIARTAKVSKGLIYLYFEDKNDVLFYALRFVLDMYDSYVTPLPARDPLEILRNALRGLCQLVNDHIPEHMLAYRSSKDLTARQRLDIKASELKIMRTLRSYLESCVSEGIVIPVDLDIMVLQYMMFAHTWALKNWVLRDNYSFEKYLAEGERALIGAFLTSKGRKLFEAARLPREQRLFDGSGRQRGAPQGR